MHFTFTSCISARCRLRSALMQAEETKPMFLTLMLMMWLLKRSVLLQLSKNYKNDNALHFMQKLYNNKITNEKLINRYIPEKQYRFEEL